MKRIVLLILIPAMLISLGCFTLPKPEVLGKELPSLLEVRYKLERILFHEFTSNQESELKADLRREIRAFYKENSDDMKVLMSKTLESKKIQNLFVQQLMGLYEGMTKRQALSLIQDVIKKYYIPQLIDMNDRQAKNFVKPWLSLLDD